MSEAKYYSVNAGFPAVVLLAILLMAGRVEPTAEKAIGPKDDPVWVRFCDLIANPASYEGRIIVTEAILVVDTKPALDGNDPYFQGENCSHHVENYAVINPLAPLTISDKAVARTYSRIITSATRRRSVARLEVTVIGRFLGPSSSSRYGHLGWARFQVTVSDVIRIHQRATRSVAVAKGR